MKAGEKTHEEINIKVNDFLNKQITKKMKKPTPFYQQLLNLINFNTNEKEKTEKVNKSK